MRPIAASLLLPLASLLLALPARGTVVRELDLETLARRAHLVVRGIAIGSASHWAPGGRQIRTVTRIEVAEQIKGQAPARIVEVLHPGGTVGELTQRVEGAPQIHVGEEVVLFLRALPGGRARFEIEGFAQGKLTVVGAGEAAQVVRDLPGLGLLASDGSVRPAPRFGPISMDELVRRVRAASSEKAQP